MKKKIVSEFNLVRYREFPRVLFGESAEGVVYFDATVCTGEEKSGDSCPVAGFKEKFGWWTGILSEAYGVPEEKMIVENGEGGNMLMEESLFLLFASYLDAAFAVYMLERMSEMLAAGIVLSDAALISMARDRLDKEDLEDLT